MVERRLTHLVTQLLGNREVIPFSPALARALGDVEAAVFLCQACYWQALVGDGDWFYKLRDADRDEAGRVKPPVDASRQSWEWETGLSRTRQESARRRLKSLGLLQENLRGVPAKLYYRVNMDRLVDFLLATRQLAGFPPTGRQDLGHQAGSTDPGKQEGLSPSITETTAKTSSTTTATRTRAASVHAVIEDSSGVGGSGGEGAQCMNLILERSVRPHRGLLNTLLAGVPAEVAQEIVDELAGALEAVATGRRQPIKSVRGWVKAVVQQHRIGQFAPDLGRAIATRRGRTSMAENVSNEDNRPWSANPAVYGPNMKTIKDALSGHKLK
ncbi:hypothetical protein [Burkholderia glumae]|uniref:hypothetical protein n=1 Tax=Burkholderia glumae TaxID=337 RepID=UPI0021510511|nr:hypothetical protein [Burkholderia glumae]